MSEPSASPIIRYETGTFALLGNRVDRTQGLMRERSRPTILSVVHGPAAGGWTTSSRRSGEVGRGVPDAPAAGFVPASVEHAAQHFLAVPALLGPTGRIGPAHRIP